MPKKVEKDGTPGPDKLDGGNFQDIIDGLEGDDEITGGNQHDTLNGGADDDTVSGDNGKDAVAGDDGNDVVSGNNGKDAVDGGAGSDDVSGGNGKDELVAGPATAPDNEIPDDDCIDSDEGEAGCPEDEGGEGGGAGGFPEPNIVTGGNGKDVIYSSFGAIFEGGEEDEIVYNDILTGGRAPDTFVFFANHGSDVITDFFKDTIDLSALGLNGFEDLDLDSDMNGDAVIDTGSGTITLEGVTVAEVNADMFLF